MLIWGGREVRVVTVLGMGEGVKVGTLYAKRDGPVDIRFGCDLPEPDEYDLLGEVYARQGGMIAVCEGGFRLMVDGGAYDAQAVATDAVPGVQLRMATSRAMAKKSAAR